MASPNPSDVMIVHKVEKIIIAGAHIVITYWTKSRVLLIPFTIALNQWQKKPGEISTENPA